MKGRTVIITGPTSGIGKEIAIALAKQGADLILACRDASAGASLAAQLGAGPGAPRVEAIAVDLASAASIEAFVRQVLDRHPRIHVLVNNAGVSRGQQSWAANADGVELTFATNVLGYYLTSILLLARLRESGPARIVNVASTFASDLDLDDLMYTKRPWDATKAYAQSKACDRLLTWALARRLEGTSVSANAMAPGLIVGTGLYRNAPPQVREMLRQRAGPSGRSPAEGADTAAWLAGSPEVEGVSGRFYENRKEIPCSFRNREAEERLWQICGSLTGRRAQEERP